MSATQALRAILAFGILTTAVHFSHNVIEVESYPSDPVSGGVVQVAAIVSWPLFAAVGVLGYRRYAAGERSAAYPLLIAWGLFAMVSLGHFLYGVPDIPAFWLGTVFTDIAAGLAMLAFVAWSLHASPGTA